jgi:hypothetical protein
MADKNPHAFPVACKDLVGNTVFQPGMTLRDWFAGQALANTHYVNDSDDNERVAAFAYQIADAMIAERAERPYED